MPAPMRSAPRHRDAGMVLPFMERPKGGRSLDRASVRTTARRSGLAPTSTTSFAKPQHSRRRTDRRPPAAETKPPAARRAGAPRVLEGADDRAWVVPTEALAAPLPTAPARSAEADVRQERSPRPIEGVFGAGGLAACGAFPMIREQR
jgi:hypothetical protein